MRLLQCDACGFVHKETEKPPRYVWIEISDQIEGAFVGDFFGCDPKCALKIWEEKVRLLITDLSGIRAVWKGADERQDESL